VPIRDRIRELRRVRASELKPNAKNWRTHPRSQQQAIQGILEEVGYADALLARELPDGSLELIDGHLRAETTPDTLVPVLVLDVSEAEAEKILLTHDPLAKLAGVDDRALGSLFASVEIESEALRGMLDNMADRYGISLVDGATPADAVEIDIPTLHQVVVECRDEPQQRELYQRLTEEGHRCRVLTL